MENSLSLLRQYAALPLVENKAPAAARRTNLSGSSGIDGIDELTECTSFRHSAKKSSLFDCLSRLISML